MAEEEKQEETTEEEAPQEEPSAGSDPSTADEAETPAADEGSDPTDAAEPAAPAGDAPPEPPPAGDEEPEAELGPKQKRKLARSAHSGEARDPRSGEQRATDRAATRKRKAAARTRARAGARQRRGAERGEGTPPVEREPGSRKVRQGTVVSAKPDKTITVRVEIAHRHPTYEKVVRRSNTVHAHDERNEAGEGDIVRVVESRPMSRLKRWRLVEIVEKAR